MKTETNYRMLGPDEKVKKGDEYLLGGVWESSGNWRSSVKPERKQMSGCQYRRPLPATPAFVPQWKHPDAPSVPVHVLWAESPSTVQTVAQVAAEVKLEASVDPGTGYRLLGPEEMVLAGDHFQGYRGDWVDVDGTVGMKQGGCGWVIRRKITAVEPGTGYRLVPQGELIQTGDEWLQADGTWRATQLPGNSYEHRDSSSTLRRKIPAPLSPIDPPAGYYILGPDEPWKDGDLITGVPHAAWSGLSTCNFGTTTNTWNRDKSPRWCCRKLPVPEPQYRPYANAAEAAAGLQGKLICHINEPGNYYHPLSVDDAGIKVGFGHRYTMIGLKEYWQFTDGTPCGVLTTNQGTK